ncbi:MAG: PQQ-like beta-propeller repeat protein [Myxococcales bacterium]|nr:PQQ-like beta-propeller repeat protein [Myxococcales bacterium]
MNRGPIVLVAMVALSSLAAGLKWRAERARRPSPATAAQPATGGSRGAALPGGIGAGTPPPGALGSRGASMLHGDPRHTHRALGRAPASMPVILWSHEVGGPVEAQVTTSADEQTLYVSSLGGSLLALARGDGSERWSVPLGERAYATPCVGPDGTVYAGTDAKKLVALGPGGKVKWTFETDGDADTAPVIAGDGTIVFAAGRMVYGLGPNGQARWRFSAKRKVYASPAIAPSGRIYFGSQDHHAYALSPRGALAWSVDLGADVDGAPVIGDDGGVFVGTDGDEVVRLDSESGAVVWRARVGGYVRGTLSAARNGDVLAGVYGPTPRAVRLRPGDGAVVGAFSVQGTGAREFGVHGGALEDEAGTVVFGTQDDSVYAVGAGGETLWRFTTGGDVDAPVTLLSDGALVVGSDDGKVYLLRAP